MTTRPAHISEEETQQLLRTVEMFEAITQVQEDDYQSLEILKEAYSKLDRKEDSLRTSRKLVDAYEKQGQVFKAILECEGILQEHPEQADIRGRLTALEKQANRTVQEPAAPALTVAEAQPQPVEEKPKGLPTGQALRQLAEDADRVMADVLILEKLATPQALQPLLQQLKTMRNVLHPEKGLPLSLTQLIVNEQYAKLEDVLTLILNKSSLPYIPLSYYDVDQDVATLIPLEACWQLCMIPFDKIGRCILIATANPFSQPVRQAVEATLKANLFWYVAAPAEIATALRRVHRVEGGTK